MEGVIGSKEHNRQHHFLAAFDNGELQAISISPLPSLRTIDPENPPKPGDEEEFTSLGDQMIFLDGSDLAMLALLNDQCCKIEDQLQGEEPASKAPAPIPPTLTKTP